MDKRISILKELLKLTKDRETNWIPTNIVDQYSLNLGTGKVVIAYNRPKEGILNPFAPEYAYQAIFYNKKEAEIESVTVREVHNGNDTYKLLQDLWNEIEDAHLGRNETLNSMLDALGLKKN